MSEVARHVALVAPVHWSTLSTAEWSRPTKGRWLSEAAPGRCSASLTRSGLPGGARRGHVDVGNEGLGPVVGLGEAVRVERVRLDDVRAGREVPAVGLGHDVRPAQVQQLVALPPPAASPRAARRGSRPRTGPGPAAASPSARR